MNVSKSNFTLSTMMMAAVVQPRIFSQSRLANSPILAFSPVNRINGQTAKPSCMLSTTWLATSNWVVLPSPKMPMTSTAGIIAMRARDQPAQPRRDAEVEKTFHHDLAGERPGEGGILPGSEQRDGEQGAGHADAEKRAEQFVGVLNFRHVLMPRPMKRRSSEDENRGVDEQREHQRATSNRWWQT